MRRLMGKFKMCKVTGEGPGERMAASDGATSRTGEGQTRWDGTQCGANAEPVEKVDGGPHVWHGIGGWFSDSAKRTAEELAEYHGMELEGVPDEDHECIFGYTDRRPPTTSGGGATRSR